MATFPAGLIKLDGNCFCGPFQSSVGDYYAFQSFQPGTVEEVMAMKASDPTGTWTEQDSGNRPKGDGDPASIRHVWCVQDGDDLHMVFSDGGYEVFYARFDMAADTWGNLDGLGRRETGPIVAAQPVPAGVTAPFSTITRRSDGDLIIAFMTSTLVMGIQQLRSHYAISTDNGETFTNNGDYTGRSDTDQAPQGSAISFTTPADRSHLFFHLAVGDDTKESTLLNDDTFGVQDNMVDTTTIISTWTCVGGRPVFFDDGTVRCRLAYENANGGVAVASWDDADSPTFSLSGTISVFAINAFFFHSQVQLVNDNKRLWYVYVHGVAPDDRISFAEDPLGDGNWGAEVELAATSFDVDMFSANLVERGGQFRIGCFAHDSDFDQLDYFESGDLGAVGGGGGSPDGTRSPLCSPLFGRSKLQSFRCE